MALLPLVMSDDNSAENRRMNEWPEMNFNSVHGAHVTISEMKAFFKDHFWGRTELVKSYNRLQLRVLSQSPNQSKIIWGEGSWLFLGNGIEKIHYKHLGIDRPDREKVDQIISHLEEIQARLDSMGIEFYFMVAPDKQTIYPEKLRSFFKRENNLHLNRVREGLKGSASLVGRWTIPDQELLAAKDKGQVYRNTNSHWNDRGAFIAYEALFGTISKHHDLPPLLKQNAFEIIELPESNETISNALHLNEVTDATMTVFKPLTALPGKMVDREIHIPEDFHRNPAEFELRYRCETCPDKKVLIWRDSFFEAMEQYSVNHFGETVLIWEFTIDWNIVAQEKPDVVVLELVERNLMKVVDY